MGTVKSGLTKKLILIAGVLSALCFGAGPALAYFEIAPTQTAFAVFALGCALGILTTVVGIVVASRSKPGDAGLGLAFGLVPTVFVVYTLATTYQYPMINDVTTDRIYPPEFLLAQELPENEDRDLSFPSEFKSQIEEGYPDLQSLGLTLDAYTVFNRAMDIAREREGWSITGSRVAGGGSRAYIFEGSAESGIFRFTDDFVVRVTDVDGGCVVDMRSKSRLGKGDLGANAARIRSFFAELEK